MISIRLDGDVRKLARVVRNLENLDFKGGNMTLAEALRESTRERFKQQKDPDDKPWKTSIRASESGGSTLTDSARLKNSIKSVATTSGFAVGTNVIYAGTHQLGAEGRTIRSKNGKGLRFQVAGGWRNKKKVTVNIPARPFLGISKDDMEEIKHIFEQLISEASS